MNSLLDSFSNNILLSNLIRIRWIAILGQLLAILLVFFYFNIQIPILICLLIVLISTIVNIVSFLINKYRNYLSDNETFSFLLFDTIQLAILLYLTGGIYNPFSLLLIAPLIISASYLRIVFSILLSFFSILIVVFLSFFYIEINWPQTFIIPQLFTFGLALSLIISIIFITVYVYTFAKSSKEISKALNQTRAVLADQSKLSEVGSLSAAAVHELSTPLNTIFLILDDFAKDKNLNKNIEIKNEIELLKSQAERCRKILLRLSKNPINLKDDFINKINLTTLIKTNFEKFNNNKINLTIDYLSKGKEPFIQFKDELMYGVGNIIQNAIQHAKKNILVEIYWNQNNIRFKIIDDGEGFSRDILNNIGNPYISNNKNNSMGLGIFIAKNLIENIGGKISFKNNNISNGSIVEILLIRKFINI